jgi:REP element-mobilizing transposase RayT
MVAGLPACSRCPRASAQVARPGASVGGVESGVMVAGLAACSRYPRASAQGFLADNLYVCILCLMTHLSGTICRPDPLAFFLTWTTYGSWMPGDARGWTDDRGVVCAPNARLARAAARLMREPSVVLTFAQRDIVERAIHEHCDFRGWTLHAAICRTTHTHVVVSAAERTPDGVLGSLKARCSRQLSRGAKEPHTWWTRGGSMRQIYDMRALENVVTYVVECQDKPRP